MRQPIDPEIKIAITLRFLATGESYESLMYQFRVHSSTISKFIAVVCNKIYETFKGRFVRLPDTTEEWEIIEHETRRLWQSPNRIGAADGKHIAIIHPSNSRSKFYNYNGFFSIILLAIVDYDYKFIFADVGCQGRISDGGVYRNSFFYRATQENLLEQINLCLFLTIPTTTAKIPSQCHMFFWLMTRFPLVNIVLNLILKVA